MDPVLLSALVILNLSGTKLKAENFINLKFTTLQFLNLSSIPSFTLSALSDAFFPTLKELLLAHTPLSPTSTPSHLPVSLRLLDLSHSPTLDSLGTLKSLIAPHPTLMVLDLSQPQARGFSTQLEQAQLSLKVWFPRVKRLLLHENS